jgi:exodeoxyribonuclease VII large subunit
MTRQPFNPAHIQVPPEERPRPGERLLTVSQVTRLVKDAIESALPPTLQVVGEISNFKRHSSGHLYFTLKDAACELACVMWRSAAGKLKFAPADGLEVIATGSVEVFERAGRYQLYVRKLEPKGVGALELAFRQLCEKLEKEGLFDPRHKKPLPPYPSRLAVITSPTGAVIADILRTVERRYPCVEVLVYPVRVQGPGAAEEVSRAIRRINQQAGSLGGVDLMIVGRGGGSLEDLWAFNEEIVARAIYASTIPVISAVGHEVDVSIADMVADVRAATPTAAAEIAVPVLDELLLELDGLEARLMRTVVGGAQLAGVRLDGLLARGVFRDPSAQVHRREQIVDELSTRMVHSLSGRMSRLRRRVEEAEEAVHRIAPHAYVLRMSGRIQRTANALYLAMIQRLSTAGRRLNQADGQLTGVSPRRHLPRHRERVESIGRSLEVSMRHRLGSAAASVRSVDELLRAMGYKSILGRGYSITRLKKGRQVIRSVKQVNDGDRVVTETGEGEFESEVLNQRQLELFE